MTAREQVWIDAWCAVAAAFNVKDKTVPTSWADQALKDFDARFPQQPVPKGGDL